MGFMDVLFGFAVAQAVASALDFDDMGVVQEAVKDGRGGGHVADEFAPFFQGAVGGHQGGAQFVAAHNDLKEVFAAFGRELLDAHIVDYEQVGFEVFAQDALVAGGVFVVAQLIDDVEDGAVEDGFAELDQLISNGLGEVAFAHSGWADEKDVLGLLEEAAGGQLVDLGFFDREVEAEVEVFEGAFVPEGGRFGAPDDAAVGAGFEFILQDQFEELLVAQAVGAGFLQAHFQGVGQG